MGRITGISPGRGSVVTQDVKALGIDRAFENFGVTGEGITIGILSDSFDAAPGRLDGGGYAADIASGDLPENISILKDPSRSEVRRLDPEDKPTDEGRAMAQLIHDIAPEADILFATAWGGQKAFANQIDALVAAGADIIVDDVKYLAEPFYADGVVARAAARAVEDGVAYFSSAGNYGDNSVHDTLDLFDSQRLGVSVHDWQDGRGRDRDFDVSVAPGEWCYFIMNWTDAYASTSKKSEGASVDLDLVLTMDNEPITFGWYRDVFGKDDFQEYRDLFADHIFGEDSDPALEWHLADYWDNTGNDPIAIIGFVNPYWDASVEVGLQVEAADDYDQPVDFKITVVSHSEPVKPADDPEKFGHGTSFGHVVANGVMGVGAANYADTPAFGRDPAKLESFSSTGISEILYARDGTRLEEAELRQAVDIVASNGGNTTFFGRDDDDRDNSPNFSGTSAAAPNAAAVAALMLQVAPDLTPAEIQAAMQATALDMNDPYEPGRNRGFDTATGAGFLQADKALSSLFNRVTGSRDSETLEGSGAADLLMGRDGHDVLNGRGGHDVLRGGGGRDSLRGNEGTDMLVGGAGDDSLYGGSGNDRLEGNGRKDLLEGRSGKDILIGGNGKDRLEGNKGSDSLIGGKGADTLSGGRGDDSLQGGAGADTFVFTAGRDRIVDADLGEGDEIVLDRDEATYVIQDPEDFEDVPDGLGASVSLTSNRLVLSFSDGDRLRIEFDGSWAEDLLIG
ncbi:MAG: S8 family serine peptidase [Pseudomonadota bacterium]